MGEPHRHLPVVPANESSKGPAAGQRPTWHWVVFGAAVSFALWAPLAMVAQWLAMGIADRYVGGLQPEAVEAWRQRASETEQVVVTSLLLGLPIVAFAIATALGGAVVAGFGKQSRAYVGGIAGAVSAASAWLMTAVGGDLLASFPALVLGSVVGFGAGMAGHALTRRCIQWRRRKLERAGKTPTDLNPPDAGGAD